MDKYVTEEKEEVFFSVLTLQHCLNLITCMSMSMSISMRETKIKTQIEQKGEHKFIIKSQN